MNVPGKLFTYINKLSLFALFSLFAFTANATLVPFNNGDSLAGWSTDRFDPSGFAIVNNELELTLSAADYQASAFHNTQGKQFNTGFSTSLSIDMFIDSAWSGLNQRIGGLWGVARDGADAISSYPIIEFHGANGFNFWDSSIGWVNPVGPIGFVYDAFNNLAFDIVANTIEFRVNDVLVYTQTDTSGTEYFGSVILQGINKNDIDAPTGGVDRTIRFDNLRFAEVPEPATLALMGLGLAGLGAARRRAK